VKEHFAPFRAPPSFAAKTLRMPVPPPTSSTTFPSICERQEMIAFLWSEIKKERKKIRVQFGINVSPPTCMLSSKHAACSQDSFWMKSFSTDLMRGLHFKIPILFLALLSVPQSSRPALAVLFTIPPPGSSLEDWCIQQKRPLRFPRGFLPITINTTPASNWRTINPDAILVGHVTHLYARVLEVSLSIVSWIPRSA